jgi:hypothetical protein
MNKTCPCANPPGGTITCRVDQLAICGMIDGEIVSGCFDRPDSGRGAPASIRQRHLANWVLSSITRRYRAPQAEITVEDLQILRSGMYEDALSNTSVKFSVPKDLDIDDLGRARPLTQAH